LDVSVYGRHYLLRLLVYSMVNNIRLELYPLLIICVSISYLIKDLHRLIGFGECCINRITQLVHVSRRIFFCHDRNRSITDQRKQESIPGLVDVKSSGYPKKPAGRNWYDGVDMVKAFIFDCFGVLASDGLLPFFDTYLAHDPELLQAAESLCRQVNAGLADYDDFIRQLSQMAHVSEQAARERIEHNVPNAELFTYIKDKLKPKYKIGFLSNAGRNWLSEIFEPWQIELFDAVVLSYEIAITKPDPRAYQTIAAKLGLAPAECIMVDDLERYVTGAREAGMQAIQYASFEQLKQELETTYMLVRQR
jgi:HAD superfamily hydrolase (TIGR01509 family)